MIFYILWFVLGGGQEAAVSGMTVVADAAATLEIDGKLVAKLLPGVAVTIEAKIGEHQVVARTAESIAWRKLVTISAAGPESVRIPLRKYVLGVAIQQQGYWRDDRTGLAWAAADSGAGLTVSQAKHYCQRLRAGGFADWRLPEIEELQPLFGGAGDERGFRVVAPLRLSGWAWSQTRGNEDAENWTLDFGDGARASVAAGDAGLNRALCVRPGR